MVIHVLPVLRRRWTDYLRDRRPPHNRQLISRHDLYASRISAVPRGWCFWCHLPAANRRRTYCSDDCRQQRDAVLGYRVFPIFPSVLSQAQCVDCGQRDTWKHPLNMEVDHELSIHLARQISMKALVAAFLLDNLRWLCANCHKQKTAADRREISIARRGVLGLRML